MRAAGLPGIDPGIHGPPGAVIFGVGRGRARDVGARVKPGHDDGVRGRWRRVVAGGGGVARMGDNEMHLRYGDRPFGACRARRRRIPAPGDAASRCPAGARPAVATTSVANCPQSHPSAETVCKRVGRTTGGCTP